jgi:hypothetical protein
VVSADSGHARPNDSWVMGRLLRDYEQHQAPFHPDKASANWEALRASVFKVSTNHTPGSIVADWVWCSGLTIIVLQLVIATVPFVLYREWIVLAITVGGTALALIQGSLPQWKSEKWSCPTGSTSTVSFTQGIGSRHLMVILASPRGHDLGILAAGCGRILASVSARICMTLLAALWIILLLTVAGLKQGSWCTYYPFSLARLSLV